MQEYVNVFTYEYGWRFKIYGLTSEDEIVSKRLQDGKENGRDEEGSHEIPILKTYRISFSFSYSFLIL